MGSEDPGGWVTTEAPPPPPPPPPPGVGGAWTPPPPVFTGDATSRLSIVGVLTSIVLICGLGIGAAVLYARSAHAPGAQSSSASAGSLNSVLTAMPATSGVTVDPAEANAVVRAVWPAREQALYQRNASTIARLETGSAAAWDVIRCTAGCPPPSPRDLIALRTFVPRQRLYPARFMAEVRTTTDDHSEPYIEIMIFTRSDPREPWRLALDSGYAGVAAMSETPVADSSGFDATPIPESPDPGTLPSSLAAYWQHWKDTGTPPTDNVFTPGYWTDEQGQYLYSYKQTLLQRGQVESVTYSADADADGVWTFALNEVANGKTTTGWRLSCGTVHYQATVVPLAAGSALIQSADQSEWGTLLAPGPYSQITNVGLHQSCFLIEVGYPGVGVVGGNGGLIKVAGVRIGG